MKIASALCHAARTGRRTRWRVGCISIRHEKDAAPHEGVDEEIE